MYFKSLRTVLVRNVSGTHDAWVQANTPQELPLPLHDAAIAAGCVQCTVEGEIMQDADPVPQTRVPTSLQLPENSKPEPGLDTDTTDVGGHTTADVVDAVTALLARNNKDDFSVGTGRPKVGVVSKLVGEKVSLSEVESAWEDVQSEIDAKADKEGNSE
jgi:hypothetical protein